MLENKDYCDYETCVALKELGYKGISRYFYATKESPLRRYSYDQILTTRIADAVGHTLAISLYVAQKWLREEKDMNVYVKAFNGEGWYYIIQNYKGARIYPPLARILVLCHSYEEALSEGIKEAVKILKEKEFHNLRKAFYIDKSIVWVPQGKSHKEYFDSINHSDFIEIKVRGYILNDTLSLYKGSDFSIPPKKEVENIVSLFASFNIKQINLGCNIGNIGEVWKPKEIIKLLKKEK